MIRTTVRVTILCLLAGFAPRTNASTQADHVPTDAEYACPMERHPDEAEPANQGPYFASEAGKCPRCGMKLKPIGNLEWVRVRRAAEGGDVAYTCPDHPHVFSESSGECPRCGKTLTPFKVMYTCPNPRHADVISATRNDCPRCGRRLAAYRGVWLDKKMADRNLPPHPGVAEVAEYHCAMHPLVHSDNPGSCTICGQALVGGEQKERSDDRSIPPTAKYVCPMKKCWEFSELPGRCSKCGMPLKPIKSVSWANQMLDRDDSKDERAYLCPMHPDTQRSDSPGTCEICGMQLVAKSDFRLPHDAPSRIAAQVNYITEHYLELQRLLASDKDTGVARQALGIASASEELLKHINGADVKVSGDLKSAVEKLRASALNTTGADLGKDRVTFVELSSAMRILIDQARPDHTRWPKLYIFHCPMSKGDWVQTTADKANPYYGFKMLKCGELQEVK